jgi:hypothetical protein
MNGNRQKVEEKIMRDETQQHKCHLLSSGEAKGGRGNGVEVLSPTGMTDSLYS